MTRWVALAPGHVPIRGTGGPDLPGSIGGCGASWDFTGEADAGAAAVDAVALRPVASGHVVLRGRRIKRTMLVTIQPGTDPAMIARFEADLAAMPRHITTIGSWALSRVDQALSPSKWTHVWEQEFADEAGYTGPYLAHPYHWTHIDRWFDPEVPGAAAGSRLAAVHRWSDGPVL